YPGCERLVVDLLTADGAPAGAIDPVGVDYRALEGVIRINLPPAISRSAVSDSLFDGALIQRAFVIATDDNQIAIDVHATPGNTLSLRAFEVASPSRIVIDVRTEENTTAVLGATLGTGVVVISPLTTETATNVVVSGYARGSTNGLLVRAFSAGDTAPITEEAVELRGESNLWREFAVELADLPARPLEITVGFRGAAGAEATRVTFDATDRRIPDPPEV
ncbi:MAG: hypothetical protein GY722_09080, partial [bacterium]|nr:hypothetical protein [bacterium]